MLIKIISVYHLFMISYTSLKRKLWSSPGPCIISTVKPLCTEDKTEEHNHSKTVFLRHRAAGSISRIQGSQMREGRHHLKGKRLMKLFKETGQTLSKGIHAAKLILNPLQQRISSLLRIKFYIIRHNAIIMIHWLNTRL